MTEVTEINVLLKKLTPKEHDCFCFAAVALQIKEIAKILKCSPRTVETHRRSYRQKLGLETNTDFQIFISSHDLRAYCARVANQKLNLH